jgi:hypothetical protein
MRCPASRFITHTLSHLCFLVLLAAATFRLDYETQSISTTVDQLFVIMDDGESEAMDDKIDKFMKETFRPAHVLITNVQVCLAFWVMGKF